MPCSMWVDIRFNVTYVGGMSEGGRDHLRVIKKKFFLKRNISGQMSDFINLPGSTNWTRPTRPRPHNNYYSR